MTFLFNDLSLHNQFHNSQELVQSLELLMNCRELLRQNSYSLNCSRETLGNRPVFNGVTFRRTIGNLQNRELQRLILRWVDQDGPFWDDDQIRLHKTDDYFTDEDDDIVTDTVLAEAACLTQESHDSSIVSLNPSKFMVTPIHIRWYKTTEEYLEIFVRNLWDVADLAILLSELAPPILSWGELRTRIMAEFHNLVFLPGFENGLKGQPFNSTIALHVIHLLSILNDLKTSFDENGERSSRGHELYNDYFTGERALFSDESGSNKIDFRRQLTFNDECGNPIFCPYHGKISFHVYRIHFSWPITKNGNLYIAYIGPKITRG